MANSTRYQAIISLDVVNAGTESEARQAIFQMISKCGATSEKKRGRPSASTEVTAAVTGIEIQVMEGGCPIPVFTACIEKPDPRKEDVAE